MATAIFLAVVGLFCFDGVIGVCDFLDAECTTRNTQAKFSEFVKGFPGVDPSDPLYQDLIEANLPNFKYTIKKGTLSGFKNCRVELVRFSKDQTYDYRIRCPLITLNSEYELKGTLGENYIEGKGTCKVDHYDYGIFFNGNYESTTRDGKTYIRFSTYTLNLDARGKVEYNFQNLFNGDKEKSDAIHKAVNENWKESDKTLRQPAMEAFMKKYMENVNNFLNIVSAEEILAYEP